MINSRTGANPALDKGAADYLPAGQDTIKPAGHAKTPPAGHNNIIPHGSMQMLRRPTVVNTSTIPQPLSQSSGIAEKCIAPPKMAMQMFHSSVFPVLCIDNHFKIIYSNLSSKKFFTGLFTLEGNLFFDVFGKYFEIEDVKAIRSAILKGENGFSWRGVAHIRSRERPTVFTRVYIFPAQMDVKAPEDFTVMFDDVTDENKRLLRSIFISLLEASKLKDNDTGMHISRVNYYSEVLAKILFNRPGYDAVDAEFIDNIGFLASMHDVGKIGTPDDVLNKEGPLSDWEWTVMKEHTKNGAFILSTYPNPMAKEIALSHHEKWNGKGYPFQIDGKMIPLSARIVAIADVYDALRMKRSYKDAMSHDAAVEKIMDSKGSHFDPELSDIFYSIAGKFNDIFESNKD
ncbi:MAG: HD-GYP domain-containing protein [Spirochaetaceae bacterium]|jgi:putative two-component system response regulator|nr:HD-GYP domain-containing protein [Spirochaetaceae bacterium]